MTCFIEIPRHWLRKLKPIPEPPKFPPEWVIENREWHIKPLRDEEEGEEEEDENEIDEVFDPTA